MYEKRSPWCVCVSVYACRWFDLTKIVNLVLILLVYMYNEMCMCVCVCEWVCVYVFIYRYVWMHIFMYTYVCIWMCVYACLSVGARIHTHTHICVCVCVCVCMATIYIREWLSTVRVLCDCFDWFESTSLYQQTCKLNYINNCITLCKLLIYCLMYKIV